MICCYSGAPGVEAAHDGILPVAHPGNRFLLLCPTAHRYEQTLYYLLASSALLCLLDTTAQFHYSAQTDSNPRFSRKPELKYGALDHSANLTLPFNLEKIELTADTTYEQYVHASLSNRVNAQKLLPPRFPQTEVSFCCDNHNYETRLHIHCPGLGSRHMKSSTTFESPDEAVNELRN